jgi:hypothetical protein
MFFHNHVGQPVFVFRAKDLAHITEWARALCHLVFGPEEGERHFRKLPAMAVLSLWATHGKSTPT